MKMKFNRFSKRKIAARILFSIALFLLSAGINSCKHDNFKEFVGESICPGKNFAITQAFQVSSNNIDLNFGGLNMTAVFTESAKWNITITGLTSGAKRTYSGKSNSINLTWYGQPGNMTFFRNEDVKVEFAINCLDELSTSDTVTIIPNNFSTFGVLTTDFDGNGMVANTTSLGYSASGWSSYGDVSVSGGTSTFNEFAIVNTPLAPPTGNQYLHLNAQPAPTSWWTGGVYATIGLSSLPTSNPDSIYFNTFVYGDSKTSLTISLSGGGTFKKTIDLGTWTGWKYISYKLSDVGVVNPLVLNTLEFGIGPSKAAGDLNELNVDLALFTAYEPLYQEQ